MRRLGLVLVLLLPVACSAVLGLSGESKCADFMGAATQQRAQIADELYTQKHGANSMGSANALLNMEYVCGQSPNLRLSEVPV